MSAVKKITVVRHHTETLLQRYGLGTLFAANVLGAGSVYILAQTGANVGFALFWVLPIAFGLDMIMHDLSGRMAKHDQPLMKYIRDVVGSPWSQLFATTMALVMQFWAVANYAVAGAVISWFTGGHVLLTVPLVSGLAVVLILTGTYGRIEAIISSLILLVFAGYSSLVFALDVPLGAVVTGLVPGGVPDATLVIAMLGTTVYYPNFFIQSSMHPTKQWTSLKRWRRDNAVGIGFTVVVSAAMLSVAALTLSVGELTLTDPAMPLIEIIGGWALPVFMIAVLAASFTSATGTLFGSGFAVPQSFGLDTEFGDSNFVKTVCILIAISTVLAMGALQYTNMTPVRMAIVMPALNGAIYLPITIFAMYMANRHRLGLKQKVVTVVAILMMVAGSVLTTQSLYQTILNWL